VTVLAIDLLEPAGSPEQDPGQFTGTTRGQSQIYCLFRQHRGVVMQDLESGFLVAFSHAPDGLACAVAIQHAMAEDWNPFQECGEQPAIVHEEGHSRCSPPTLARIALCTGSVEFRDRACQGTAVTDATRLLVAGNRGQILCSEVTAGLLRREIDPGLSLVDLGFHCLHDGVAPERLFQVDYPGMTFGQFPPPNAVRASSSSLPPQFNRFFGREEEIHTLCDLLLPAVKDADGPPEHAAEAWNAGTLPARLVTLTGPGGSGKTRLALEVANRLQVAFDGAVWLVPLAKLTEPGLIPITVRDALRLPRSPHVDVLDQVVTALSHRPSLLLLDNFEQLLIEGAAVVQALMERVEGLMVLATSRRRLGLPGEREVPVPPLPTPNRDLPPEQLVRCESVQLFVDRAQAVRSDFQVTWVNAPAVAALCARLDGIPLALELAAARAQVLTPAQMLARLERRFQLLVNHKQEPDARHQSLEAALDWSYELLSPELQRFFVRLSVFRGGWTLAAAHAVCDVESEGLALDCVQRLVDDSLILVGEERDEMRFRMLETVQEYAAQRLCEGERLEAARRHLGYYLALAEQAEPELRGPTQQQWFERLDREHENLEAALAWGVEHQDLKATLRLVRVLTPFWRTRGYFPPLREELFNLASSPDAFACSPALAAAVLSNLAWYRGTDEGARVLQEKILAIRRELGDREGIAHSLQALGNLAEEQGDYSAAHAFFGESLTIWRELGDPKGIADLLHCVGLLAQQQSDYRTARASYEESLAIRRTLGDRNSIAASLHRLGNLAEEQGDYERARSLQEQCLATRRELGYKDGVAYSLYSLALVAFRQGDYLRAQMLFEESLEIRRATRNPHGTAMSLWGLGLVGQQQCDCAAARSFFEESLEIRRRSGDRRGVALSLWGLGRVAQKQGNHVTAQARLGESLTIARDLGVNRDIAQNIEGLAATALAQCQTARAVRLFAAAEALRSTIGAPASPVDAAEYGHGMTTARVRLGDEAFDAARAEGQAMTLEEVICAALADSEIATLGEG
jgi:predicted ATPase